MKIYTHFLSLCNLLVIKLNLLQKECTHFYSILLLLIKLHLLLEGSTISNIYIMYLYHVLVIADCLIGKTGVVKGTRNKSSFKKISENLENWTFFCRKIKKLTSLFQRKEIHRIHQVRRNRLVWWEKKLTISRI